MNKEALHTFATRHVWCWCCDNNYTCSTFLILSSRIRQHVSKLLTYLTTGCCPCRKRYIPESLSFTVFSNIKTVIGEKYMEVQWSNASQWLNLYKRSREGGFIEIHVNLKVHLLTDKTFLPVCRTNNVKSTSYFWTRQSCEDLVQVHSFLCFANLAAFSMFGQLICPRSHTELKTNSSQYECMKMGFSLKKHVKFVTESVIWQSQKVALQFWAENLRSTWMKAFQVHTTTGSEFFFWFDE